jgi:hypothetical protein
VVYVNGVKKPGWCAIVRLKHRNPFAMPEATNKGNKGEIDGLTHTCKFEKLEKASHGRGKC